MGISAAAATAVAAGLGAAGTIYSATRHAPSVPAIPPVPQAASPSTLASPAVAFAAATRRSQAAAAAGSGAITPDTIAPPATAKSGLLGAQ